MFVKTVNVKNVCKTIFTVLFIALAALAVILFVRNLVSDDSIILETEQQRQEFLTSMGWEISGEPINVREVVIPSEWNEVFSQYNAIQMQQGFDLDDFRGKNVTIYTYEVYNYENKPENMIANLMVYENKLIGGDVSCTELGGFIQGLMKLENND